MIKTIKSAFSLAIASAVLAGAGSVHAHHSIASEFDNTQRVEVTGTVVEWKLINPHTYLLLDVENEDGEIERWTVNFGPATKLIRGSGWSQDILSVGDVVTARGRKARKYVGMYMDYLVTDDGRVLLDALVD